MQLQRYSRLLFATSFALALAGSALPESAAAGTLQSKTILVGGVQRSYSISTPPGFPDGVKRYSLVFVLHGGSQAGTDVADQSQMAAYGDQHGFVVVFPNTNNTEWNDGRSTTSGNGKDVAFINAIVDQKVGQGNVDATRVYVAGVSSGGMMAQRLACDSNRFAAVAAIVSNMPSDYVSQCHPPRQRMPIEFFLSTADPLMPYNGGTITSSANLGAGGTVVSATQTVGLWTNYNRCTGDQVLPIPDRVNDGTHVIRHTYSGCRVGGEVIFFEVDGGGHCWDGIGDSAQITGICTKNVNASDEIVNFFQAYGL